MWEKTRERKEGLDDARVEAAVVEGKEQTGRCEMQATHSIVPPSWGSTHSLLINSFVFTVTVPVKALVSKRRVKTDESEDIVQSLCVCVSD